MQYFPRERRRFAPLQPQPATPVEMGELGPLAGDARWGLARATGQALFALGRLAPDDDARAEWTDLAQRLSTRMLEALAETAGANQTLRWFAVGGVLRECERAVAENTAAYPALPTAAAAQALAELRSVLATEAETASLRRRAAG